MADVLTGLTSPKLHECNKVLFSVKSISDSRKFKGKVNIYVECYITDLLYLALIGIFHVSLARFMVENCA